MSFTTFITEKHGDILTVKFSNGDVNILSATMTGELIELVNQLSVDTETKVVVFESANDEFFIAHFDINDIIRIIEGDESIPASETPGLNILQALGLAIQNLPQVTVAKVDGICRGGGFEFMLALDMCFTTERSKFSFPEAAVGFLPAGGGSTLLPLKAGSSRAREVMLSGRDFSGKEAAQYDFVNRSFKTSKELDDYVSDVTKRFSSNNRDAILAVKSVTKSVVSVLGESIQAGMTKENELMNQCLSDPSVIAIIRKLAAITGSRDTEIDLLATINSTKDSVN